MRSQLKIGVAIRSSSVQLFPGKDITKTSLKREIEGYIKRVLTGNLSYYHRYKADSNRSCDHEIVAKMTKIFKVES